VTTSQRIAISLLSVLLALAIASPLLAVLNSPHNPKLWLTATLGFFFYGLLFCAAAWLVGLPLVVLVRRTDGWHFWTALAIGTAIGPITITLFALWQGLKSNIPLRVVFFHRNPLTNALTWLAAAIALLTTLFFLLALRRTQREQNKDVGDGQIQNL
jgi:hypothetical protein